jgi:DNA-binding GntR family transcriptional regulator
MGPDQTVYESIQRAILSQRLAPGTKLTEEKLSTLFGVSRERIRKVFQRLAHDKCIELKPNRGAYVAQPGIREAREVFAARRLIEAHLVDLIATNAGPKDFSRLEANLASERQEHLQDQFKEAVSTSGDFHLLLAEVAGNQVLADILKDLVARSSLILSMYGQRRFSLCGLEEHEEIVKKLKDGQQARARKLMQDHLQEIEDQLRFDERAPRHADLAEIFSGG